MLRNMLRNNVNKGRLVISGLIARIHVQMVVLNGSFMLEVLCCYVFRGSDSIFISRVDHRLRVLKTADELFYFIKEKSFVNKNFSQDFLLYKFA